MHPSVSDFVKTVLLKVILPAAALLATTYTVHMPDEESQAMEPVLDEIKQLFPALRSFISRFAKSESIVDFNSLFVRSNDV